MAEITCVMPVYNCAKIVEIGIRSVLSQDYPDWELIVIDDSTDETPDVVERLCGDDERVRHIRFKRWMSLMRKRDIGVAAGSGRWIAQFDADDYQPPCRLTVQSAAVDDDETMAVCHIPFVHFAAPFSSDEYVWQLVKNKHPLQLACGSTFFFSRELWHRIGGHDIDRKRGGDLRFAHKVAAAGGVSVPAPSDYSESFLGLEHDANNWGPRLKPPAFAPTDRLWSTSLPEWALEILEKDDAR